MNRNINITSILLFMKRKFGKYQFYVVKAPKLHAKTEKTYIKDQREFDHGLTLN